MRWEARHLRPTPRRILPRAATTAVLLAVVLLAGCTGEEARVLGGLPGPVFQPVPAPWPTTAPDVPRRPEDVHAGWRNHAAPTRPWRWIVVHHSATPGGDARKFDRFHREVRGWDELGYHFVIGNGTDSPDGRVEVGPRWIAQKHGAHCKTPSRRFNDFGVGVCLVGDFEQTRPTAAQWASLIELCRFLCREYGIPPGRIIGHRDGQAAEGEMTTECPGRNLDLAAVRRAVEGEQR